MSTNSRIFYAQPSRKRLPYDVDTEFYGVITLQPPAIAEAERAPFDCAVVLDNSGSMEWGSTSYPRACPDTRPTARYTGSRLDAAKIAIRRLIDHATTRDRIGLVTFDDYADVVSTPIVMNDGGKQRLRQLVDGVRTRGWTNLYAGTERGLRLLGDLTSTSRPSTMSAVRRAMVFSDGRTNRGVTDTSSIVDSLRREVEGVTISTFGFGDDHDASLMRRIAEVGRGSYHFIRDVEEIPRAFGIDFGGLTSVYGRDVHITIENSDKVEVIEVVNDMVIDRDERSLRIRCDDVLAEQPFSIVLKLKARSRTRPLVDSHVGLMAKVEFVNALTGETKTHRANLRFNMVKSELADTRDDSEVMRIVALPTAARALSLAQTQANAGNLEAARYTLGGASARARSWGAENVTKGLLDIRDSGYTNETQYRSGGDHMSSSARRGLTRQSAGTGNVTLDASLSNTSQRRMGDAFSITVDSTAEEVPDVKTMVTSTR